MTKMAATPIHGKNPLKVFSGTGGQISTKLGMKHLGLQPIIVCSNDDPQLTLTYFTVGLGRYGCHLIRYVSRYMQCDTIRITIYRHFDTATLTSPNLVVKSYKNCTFFYSKFCNAFHLQIIQKDKDFFEKWTI